MFILHVILGLLELYIIVNIKRIKSYHTIFVLIGFFAHAYFMRGYNIYNEFFSNEIIFVIVTWDTFMAQNVAKIAKDVIKTSKDKLLVFAGALHIEQDLGIPLRFARLSNLPFISISNQKIDKEADLKIDTNKADFVYIYEPVEEDKKSK